MKIRKDFLQLSVKLELTYASYLVHISSFFLYYYYFLIAGSLCLKTLTWHMWCRNTTCNRTPSLICSKIAMHCEISHYDFVHKIGQLSKLIQVTFSEKGTKWHPNFSFWNLCFSNKIHKNRDFLSLLSSDTLFWTEKGMKYFFLWILLKKLRISNFEMWSWDVIFVPFSEKVTCTSGHR